MSRKVKHHKMDSHKVSSEAWEIQYIAKKFGVTTKLVRKFKKEIGTSRQAIYFAIRNYVRTSVS